MRTWIAIVCVILYCAAAHGDLEFGEPHHFVPQGRSSIASCDFISFSALQSKLRDVVDDGAAANHGLGNHMWATVVSADGDVCQVAFSGSTRFDQWRLSRVISAQKANTAASLCLPGFAIATANLFQPAQNDEFLNGLQHSNPVNPDVAYRGEQDDYGTSRDPMRGRQIGGVNIFGGGLCLYSKTGKVLGGLGVSGDTSCADHIIAWKLRNLLGMDYVVAGPHGGDDNIIFSANPSGDARRFTHPLCPAVPANEAAAQAVAEALPAVRIRV